MAQRQRKGQAAKTSGGGNGMFYGVLGVIALAGIVTIGYALVGGGGAAANELVELELTDAREIYERATPATLGRPDAPVKVVEFGDYQCPACGQFTLQVKPALIDEFIESGQVQLVYYDFPLVSIHENAVVSARAARCAGDQELPRPAYLQDVPGDVKAGFWAYQDKLFQEQNNWAYEQGSVVDEFVGYAGEIGLDEGEFEQCLRSDRFADVITANSMLAQQLGLGGTPTVIVNNRRVENWRPDNLAAVIREALGGQAAPATDDAG